MSSLSVSVSKSLGSAPNISSPVTMSVILPVCTMSAKVSCSCIEVLGIVLFLLVIFLISYLVQVL